MITCVIWIDNGAVALRSGLHTPGAVACGSFFGVCGRCLVAAGSNARTGGGTRRIVATGRAEARQRSRRLLNVGRLPLLLKRPEAADCIAEHLSRGGGITPAPGNTSRRSSFLFPL